MVGKRRIANGRVKVFCGRTKKRRVKAYRKKLAAKGVLTRAVLVVWNKKRCYEVRR